MDNLEFVNLIVGKTGFKGFQNDLEKKENEGKKEEKLNRDELENNSSKSFSIAEKLRKEQAEMLERISDEKGEDVFDKYKKKTVSDTENDYQKRWRKNGKLRVSPERSNPFKLQKNDGKKKSYSERFKEQEVSKELKGLKKEFDSVQKDRWRRKEVEKRNQDYNKKRKRDEKESEDKTKVKRRLFEQPNFSNTGLLH